VLEEWAANLSNPEIGDLLGMSNQAVRTALSRAKGHLRDAFRELCRERGIDPDVLGP
jgi:DNA-directed RNA polymerase specialized sigma24 family protein